MAADFGEATMSSVWAKLLGGAGLGLFLALLWVAPAGAGPGDWSVSSDKEVTNVPDKSRSFRYLHPVESPSGRGTHQLIVRMPHHQAPTGRALVTIERSFTSVAEGDHVTLTYSGDSSEVDATPAPTLAIYVHCVFEDQADGEKKKAWVRVGIAEVPPAPHIQALRATIKGKGCVDTVDLGVSREIDGARIQLLGADEKSDHQRRAAYLYEFKLYDPGQGENNPTLSDDFTKAK
jgi:hypothetical protein